jgi:hypothetical protein
MPEVRRNGVPKVRRMESENKEKRREQRNNKTSNN